MRFQPGDDTGPLNPRWAGDVVSPQTGRLRARRIYPGRHECSVNGCEKVAERHHVDGNTSNNDPSNIQFLCSKHHKEVDGRMHRPEFRAAWRMAVCGRRLSAEHRAKVSRGLMGRVVTESTRQKIAQAHLIRNAAKPKLTACRHGHSYPENAVKRNGSTSCAECARIRARADYWRKKGVAA